jgi:hypothetical protein
MAESAQAQTLPAARPLSVRGLLAAYWFPFGVGGIVAVVGAFLVHQLTAWPPHEDETLALFVGRDSLFGVVEHVTRDRGGAPLHFLLAWGVAHLGGGLGALRVVSVVFALGSLPLVALLGRRLAGRVQGLVATALVAASWLFLFHAIYGRMYSLFLFLATASLLLLLRALERESRGWVWWAAAILLAVAAHPYGALVLAGQGLYVLVARRDRLRESAIAFGAVVVAGIPFWITDFVLAGRFDVGVGGGGERLGGLGSVASYLWHAAGDATAGWAPALTVVLVLGAIGLERASHTTRLLALATIAAPLAAFLLARVGSSASPESRHLIFVVPLLAVLVAIGVRALAGPAPLVAIGVVATLLVAEVAWAWHRTPPLFTWEPDARQAARAEASAYLAATSRPDDVLFGYDPLFLGAWERDGGFARVVVPRADPRLAVRTLERQPEPLGRGVWVLDASDTNNAARALEIELLPPEPAEAFVTRRFGPFLVVRTSEPTGTPRRFLQRTVQVERTGRVLGLGDPDVNLQTAERALRLLSDR